MRKMGNAEMSMRNSTRFRLHGQNRENQYHRYQSVLDWDVSVTEKLSIQKHWVLSSCARNNVVLFWTDILEPGAAMRNCDESSYGMS